MRAMKRDDNKKAADCSQQQPTARSKTFKPLFILSQTFIFCKREVSVNANIPK